MASHIIFSSSKEANPCRQTYISLYILRASRSGRPPGCVPSRHASRHLAGLCLARFPLSSHASAPEKPPRNTQPPAHATSRAHSRHAALGGRLFLFTVFDTATKFLAVRYSVFQIMSVEFTTATVLFSAVALARDWNAPQRAALRMAKPHLHLMRAAFLIAGQSLTYLAIPHLSLAEFYIIVFCMPAVSVLKAGWFLKERAAAHIWPLLAVNFIGVLIALRPAEGINPWAPVALCGVVLLAGSMVVLRKMGETETPEMVVIGTGVALALASLMVMPFVYKPMALQDFGLMVLAGVLFAPAQILLYRGVPAGPGGACQLAAIPAAGLWRICGLSGVWRRAGHYGLDRRRHSHRRQCGADLPRKRQSAAQPRAEAGEIAARRLITHAIGAKRCSEGFGVGGFFRPRKR